jgi:hypothetical protein
MHRQRPVVVHGVAQTAHAVHEGPCTCMDKSKRQLCMGHPAQAAHRCMRVHAEEFSASMMARLRSSATCRHDITLWMLCAHNTGASVMQYMRALWMRRPKHAHRELLPTTVPLAAAAQTAWSANTPCYPSSQQAQRQPCYLDSQQAYRRRQAHHGIRAGRSGLGAVRSQQAGHRDHEVAT